MVKNKVKKPLTDHNGKEIKIQKGKNIRFSNEGHKKITAYCKTWGYNLGSFCEVAALMRIDND